MSLGGFDHVSERELWETVVQRHTFEITDKASAVLVQVGPRAMGMGMGMVMGDGTCCDSYALCL